MLTQQLRELERERIIERKVYQQVPPKVEYMLTPLGRTLLPIMDAMCAWGVANPARKLLRKKQGGEQADAPAVA